MLTLIIDGMKEIRFNGKRRNETQHSVDLLIWFNSFLWSLNLDVSVVFPEVSLYFSFPFAWNLVLFKLPVLQNSHVLVRSEFIVVRNRRKDIYCTPLQAGVSENYYIHQKHGSKLKAVLRNEAQNTFPNIFALCQLLKSWHLLTGSGLWLNHGVTTGNGPPQNLRMYHLSSKRNFADVIKDCCLMRVSLIVK